MKQSVYSTAPDNWADEKKGAHKDQKCKRKSKLAQVESKKIKKKKVIKLAIIDQQKFLTASS